MPLMRYAGGKNAAGTWQRILNQIPPHATYIEPFCGSAAVLRKKRPAERSIAIDLDPRALAVLAGESSLPPNTLLLEECGIEFLETFAFTGDEFVYCDPPYLPETRVKRRLYDHEMSREQHERLLGVLLRLPCAVMLSGYRSALYARQLRRWRTDCFRVKTRGGTWATECLWMNYPAPAELHDPRFVGANYRQRENLSRQKRRWIARLGRMSAGQRQALLDAIREAGLLPGGTGGNGVGVLGQ
jgi:DNA adenine methylase